jgi:hypothetical protein
MKRHLFKVILGGFIVFLALPVIFDADGQEAVVKPAALNASTDADGGSEVMLPVVQKALPFRSENVLSKYAGRFKRFYVNSKEEKQKISQEIQQEQNGLVYASSDSFGGGVRSSYGRAASAEDEAYVKEYFNDVEAKDAPANYGAIAATAGTKQKIHDNAPVKGLYESSAVDSYEARIKAKEVYSNVMSRVDTATSSKVAVEEEEVIIAPSAKRAVYASASDAQDGKGSSVGTGNKYIGIASKGSSRPSSVSSGSLSGGFGRGGVSAKEADSSSSGISMGNFEVAAQNVEGKVEKVAPEGGVSKSFTVASNGQAGRPNPSNPANPNQPQKPGTQPNNPNNPVNPNNPNNPAGEDPQPKPKPNTFDPSKWVSEYHVTCSADSYKPTGPSVLERMNIQPVTLGGNAEKPEVNADASEENTDIHTDKKEAPVIALKNNQPNWSVPCDGFPHMPSSIVDKYKFLIIAGVKDGKYVAAADNSFEGTLLTESGGKYADIPVERAKDGYYYIPEHVLNHQMLKDKNIIPVVREGEDIKGVYVKPGSLKEDRAAYDKMISDIEKYSQTQAAEAAKKAADDAEAAKKAEQEKIDKNKKEVVDQTKEAVEKVNGK